MSALTPRKGNALWGLPLRAGSALWLVILAGILVAPMRTAQGQTFTTIYGFGSYSYQPTGIEAPSSLRVTGPTEYGGAHGFGTIYDLVNSGGEWSYSDVYDFTGGPDGAYPVAQVGSTYATISGGAYGHGTIVSISLTGGVYNYKTLYSFCALAGCQDGAFPVAVPLEYGTPLGTVYGTASGGGAYGLGVLYVINGNTGAETVLHSFAGGSDGEYPVGPVAVTSGGMLYGATMGDSSTGEQNYGTIFQYDLETGAYSVLHQFTGGADGAYPLGVVVDGSGNVYGATFGSPPDSILFKITPAGVKSTLYNLPASPTMTPVFDAKAGALYGGTSSQLYEITLGGTFSVLHQNSCEGACDPTSRHREGRNGQWRCVRVDALGAPEGPGAARSRAALLFTPLPLL